MWRNIGFFTAKMPLGCETYHINPLKNGFCVGLAVKNDFHKRERCEFLGTE
jgi:hypothetical protein